MSLIALVPILRLLNKSNDLKYFASTGYIYGLFFYSLSIFWLNYNEGTSQFISFITFTASVLYLSLFPMLIFLIFGIISKKIEKRFLFLPLIWVSIEYCNSLGQLGFPWFVIGAAMSSEYFPMQISEYTGVYGVSFWIILSNILFYLVIKKMSMKLATSTFIVLLSPFIIGLGIHAKSFDYGSKLKVGIVQPDISQSIKWNKFRKNEIEEKLLSLTRNLFDRGAEIVFLPESSIPGIVISGRTNSTINKLTNLIPNDELIVAGAMYRDNGKYYNSAIVIDSSGIADISSKLQLVPIAERVPLSNYFPILANMNIGAGNFEPGDSIKILNYKDISFGAMICFESIFSSLSSEFVNEKADFLVYLVNDGWYEKSPEPMQHFNHSIIRAIETRRNVLRVTNRGISAVINEYGQVEEILDEYVDGTILATVSPITYKTFYSKFGNLFAKFCMLFTFVMVFISIKRR